MFETLRTSLVVFSSHCPQIVALVLVLVLAREAVVGGSGGGCGLGRPAAGEYVIRESLNTTGRRPFKPLSPLTLSSSTAD